MILQRPPADAGGFSVINQRNKIRNNLIICFRRNRCQCYWIPDIEFESFTEELPLIRAGIYADSAAFLFGQLPKAIPGTDPPFIVDVVSHFMDNLPGVFILQIDDFFLIITDTLYLADSGISTIIRISFLGDILLSHDDMEPICLKLTPYLFRYKQLTLQKFFVGIDMQVSGQDENRRCLD